MLGPCSGCKEFLDAAASQAWSLVLVSSLNKIKAKRERENNDLHLKGLSVPVLVHDRL